LFKNCKTLAILVAKQGRHPTAMALKLTSHQQKRLCATLQQVAETVLEGSEYIPLAVDVEEGFGRVAIQVFVERADRRINLDECAEVSRLLEPAFENLAEVQALSYTLDVSSPGLFRHLKTLRELQFYVGKTVSVKPLDLIEAKESYATLERFQLKQVQETAGGVLVHLLNEAGESSTLQWNTLPEDKGLCLAPPIQWPNETDEDAPLDDFMEDAESDDI
jgi:ribosome maturation factor RimP